MSRGFNKAILMGNLSRDPEIRYTVSKQCVAKITVAVNRTWFESDGSKREEVDFIPVVIFGKSAENAERYLRKGKPVLVEGRIHVRNYETAQGEKRWVTEIVADNVVYLSDGKPKENTGFPLGDGEVEMPMR